MSTPAFKHYLALRAHGDNRCWPLENERERREPAGTMCRKCPPGGLFQPLDPRNSA